MFVPCPRLLRRGCRCANFCLLDPCGAHPYKLRGKGKSLRIPGSQSQTELKRTPGKGKSIRKATNEMEPRKHVEKGAPTECRHRSVRESRETMQACSANRSEFDFQGSWLAKRPPRCPSIHKVPAYAFAVALVIWTGLACWIPRSWLFNFHDEHQMFLDVCACG